jgi:hypothetical protein
VKHVPLLVLVLGLVSCSQPPEEKEHRFARVILDGSSYRCLCACDIVGMPILGEATIYPDIDICVEPGTDTEEDCAARVCPATEILIKAALAEGAFVNGCEEVAELQVSCTPYRVRPHTEELDCATSCPEIDCELTLNALQGELGGNGDSCTKEAICGEETPTICRAPGVTWYK